MLEVPRRAATPPFVPRSQSRAMSTFRSPARPTSVATDVVAQHFHCESGREHATRLLPSAVVLASLATATRLASANSHRGNKAGEHGSHSNVSNSTPPSIGMRACSKRGGPQRKASGPGARPSLYAPSRNRTFGTGSEASREVCRRAVRTPLPPTISAECSTEATLGCSRRRTSQSYCLATILAASGGKRPAQLRPSSRLAQALQLRCALALQRTRDTI